MSGFGSYWENLARSRITRRRALQAGVGAGAGAVALSLIGCGGGDETTGIEGDASGLLTKPVDTTAKAAKGTSLPFHLAGDPPSFSNEGNTSSADAANHGYSRLVRFKSIKYPEPRTAIVEGDAMESWEFASDGLTMTMKLRPNQKFDPRPPTSGRVMTGEDAKYSWDRFAERNGYGSLLANSKDETAPVLSVQTPDSKTLVMKLAYPYAGLLPMLAYTRHIVVYPVEAESKYDTGHEMRGSGAWRVKEQVPSVRLVYEANPDWYDAKIMLPAQKEYPIIPEYTTQLAQFRAGRIATMTMQPEDVLPAKRDLPELAMFANEEFTQAGDYIRFGWIPENPFAKDERLRQALSMLNDRDLFIDTFYNTEQFSAEGLTQPRRWHTVIPVGYDDYWLDPRDQAKFGENAKYYQYDPAEAKKLAQAATGGKVVESDLVYRARDAQFNRMAEVTQAMWEATGDFKFNVKTPPENEWRANYNRAYGQFVGAAIGPVQAGPDVDSQIVGRLLPDTDRTGNIMLGDNATLVKLIEDQRKELDVEKRKQIIHELQRYCAKKQVFLMDAGEALGYTLAWSWLSNFRVYRIWTGDAEATGVDPHLWVDESKRSA